MKVPLDVSIDDDGKILIAGISHDLAEAQDLISRIQDALEELNPCSLDDAIDEEV